jgi:hypothetical protein
MSLRSNLSQGLLNPGCCRFASCPLCVLPSPSCWQTARCYRPSRQGHSQIRTRHAAVLTAAEMLTGLINPIERFLVGRRASGTCRGGGTQVVGYYPLPFQARERSAATAWRRLRRSRAPGHSGESRPAKQFGCASLVPEVARNATSYGTYFGSRMAGHWRTRAA